MYDGANRTKAEPIERHELQSPAGKDAGQTLKARIMIIDGSEIEIEFPSTSTAAELKEALLTHFKLTYPKWDLTDVSNDRQVYCFVGTEILADYFKTAIEIRLYFHPAGNFG